MSNDEVNRWTVLVVDDEPDNIGVVEKLLTFYGATVHIAYHGEEGLRLLQDITPTFILLDLSMPTMDGWEMLAAVKADPVRMKIPVIALTAHAMPDDVERVKKAGFDGYIPKPLRIATFLLEIQTCLESHIAKVAAQAEGASETESKPETPEVQEKAQDVAQQAAQETVKVDQQNELQSVDNSRR